MSRLSLALCTLALAALSCTSALADTLTFDFNFTGSKGISGSGVFTATSDGHNQYLINDILSGTTNTGVGADKTISTLLDPGSFPLLASDANDNLLLYTKSTNSYDLDVNGMSYELSNGADINLFAAGSNSDYVLLQRAGGKQVSESVDLTITEAASPVPEPGSLALLGTGVLGLAGFVRRRLAA